MQFEPRLPQLLYGQVAVLHVPDGLVEGSRVCAGVEHHAADIPVIAYPVLSGTEVAAHHSEYLVHGLEGYGYVEAHGGILRDVLEDTAYLDGYALPFLQEKYLADGLLHPSELLGERAGYRGLVPAGEDFHRVSCQEGTGEYLEIVGVGEDDVIRSVFALLLVEDIAGAVADEGGAGCISDLRYLLSHVVCHRTRSLAVGVAALIGLGVFLLDAVDVLILGIELVIAALK